VSKSQTKDRLPRDEKAERLAIGAIIAYPDCAPEVFGKLYERDFIDPAHQTIYRVMLAHRGRGLGVDPPLIGAELRGSAEFPDGNAAGYLPNLATKPRRRTLGITWIESVRQRRSDGYSASAKGWWRVRGMA
jgi:replicative DNA helicase